MLKQKAVWEQKDKNGESHSFHLPPNASLGDCYDIACQYKAYIVKRIEEEQKASEQQPKEDSQNQPEKGAD